MAVTVQPRDLSSIVSYLKQCQQQALRAESQTGQECSCSSPEYSPQLLWFVAQGFFWVSLSLVASGRHCKCVTKCCLGICPTRRLASVSGHSWLLSLVCPAGKHAYVHRLGGSRSLSLANHCGVCMPWHSWLCWHWCDDSCSLLNF